MPRTNNQELLDTQRLIQAAHDLEHYLKTTYGSFLLFNTELQPHIRDLIRQHITVNPRPNLPNPNQPSTRTTRRAQAAAADSEAIQFPHG